MRNIPATISILVKFFFLTGVHLMHLPNRPVRKVTYSARNKFRLMPTMVFKR